MRLPALEQVPVLRVIHPFFTDPDCAMAAGAVITVGLYVLHVVTTIADPSILALGRDFSSFYAAGRLAWLGHPLDAYDAARHWAEQKAVLGPDQPRYAFFYPPVFLLICLPLGALGYYAALACWLGSGLLAYLAAMRAWFVGWRGTWAALGFSMVLLTAAYGQNAFLTTALLATSLSLLDRRPLLAGVICGLMIFKPHLALAVPVLLVAQGRWRVIVGGLLGGLAALALATLVFGPSIWPAYFAAAAESRVVLETGKVDYAHFASLFALARWSGASVPLAYGMQAFTAVAALASLVVAARRCSDTRLLGGLVVLTTALCTPFMLEYDLLILAIPIARLHEIGRTEGWLRGERVVIAVAYLSGLAFLLLFGYVFPLDFFVVLALFGATLRRALWSPAGQQATADRSLAWSGATA